MKVMRDRRRSVHISDNIVGRAAVFTGVSTGRIADQQSTTRQHQVTTYRFTNTTTCLLILITVGPKWTLAASHAAPWLVAWHSGRTSVFGRRTFPVLRSTCSWRVTTCVGKPSAIGQTTRPTQPFILRVDKWVVSWNWMSATSVRGGAIWWTLTDERQAWCNLQVKLCDPCLSALRLCVVEKALYKYSSFHFLSFPPGESQWVCVCTCC